ncbi:hypothetical protein GCM10028807_32500 [Spirosoma daeguense]
MKTVSMKTVAQSFRVDYAAKFVVIAILAMTTITIKLNVPDGTTVTDIGISTSGTTSSTVSSGTVVSGPSNGTTTSANNGTAVTQSPSSTATTPQSSTR